jgi:two-component system, NtrC family, response regulator
METKPKLLIIDDDESIRFSLEWALSEDYELFLASNRTDALNIFETQNPPLVTLDLGLPPDPNGPEEGFKTLSSLIERNASAKVIVITGQEEKQHAIQAIGQGAYDFFQKPIKIEELKIILRRAAYVYRLEEDHRNLQERLSCKGFNDILGTCGKIQEVFATIEKVADSDYPVLILGESGTGKELVANAIHERSFQKKGPFVPINCGAIPDNLLESELFGHEKGAFTGAHAQRKGRVEMAESGTLFLDEIGELPLPLQTKLLRFLQEHKVERVGGRKEILIDTRVIAATNKDLVQEVHEKRFREDLYYRLGVITISLPPLRDREGDITLLATSFLNKYAAENKKKIFGFTKSALYAIESYPWPGNIRELENRMKRAVIMAPGSRLTKQDLGLEASDKDRVLTLKEARDILEKEMIVKSLARNGNNLTRVAAELGISRPTLYEFMEKLGIKRDELS